MERIRKYNNVFQVLITPGYTFDAGYNLLLGNWTDSHLNGYSIKEFNNYESALDEAFQYPQLDWYKLILFQKDIFIKLKNIIKKVLHDAEFIAEFDCHIMTPDELKNTMFDRVLIYGDRFRLTYNLNDVIGFHIINPWTKNLREMYYILKSIPELKIRKHLYSDGVIRIIGETDLSTTYEIVLWPTLIAQYGKWTLKHPNMSKEQKDAILKIILEQQQKLDTSIVLR
jgi:hypothetical protein